MWTARTRLLVLLLIALAAAAAKTKRNSDRSTSSSSGERADSGDAKADSLDISISGGSSSSSDGDRDNKYKPKSTAERRGWRKWHRKCTPCPSELEMKWRDPRISWICGGYQRARRSFKSLCMMHYRNCQDGTMFVQLHPHRCDNSTDTELRANSSRRGDRPHGDHFMYDYRVMLSADSTGSDTSSASSESSESSGSSSRSLSGWRRQHRRRNDRPRNDRPPALATNTTR